MMGILSAMEEIFKQIRELYELLPARRAAARTIFTSSKYITGSLPVRSNHNSE